MGDVCLPLCLRTARSAKEWSAYLLEVAGEAKSGVVRPLLPRHLAALLFPAISLTRLSGPSTDALRRRRRLHSPSPVAVATPSSTSRPGTVPRLIRGDNMGGRARKGSLYFLSRSGSGVAGFRQPGGGSGSAGYLWMPPLYLRIARVTNTRKDLGARRDHRPIFSRPDTARTEGTIFMPSL